MNKRFQILSLDGGGVKGIFSAAVLAHFEEDLTINIIDHFDLIVGTSTGGIIALGLGLGLKPKKILEFYINESPEIFKQSKFSNVRQYKKNKYDPEALENSLKKYFGENRLAESKKRLVIPSYNISSDNVYLFKTPHHVRLRRDYKIQMWKVGMATSAAPTYFPSYTKVDKNRLIDGGVWANNPMMVGLVEALSLLNIPLDKIKIFSLGTTDELRSRPTNLDTGGFFQWRKEAVNVIMQGQSIGAYTQAKLLLGEENALRFNPAVPEGLFAIDKLEIDELLALAADKSRHLCPEFEKSFATYNAEEFKPIYT